jgi:hypothetical protein
MTNSAKAWSPTGTKTGTVKIGSFQRDLLNASGTILSVEEWSGGGGRSRTYDTADMSRML